MDEQVRRRQVQLPTELGRRGARVADPHRLVSQPLAAEPERRPGDRLEQRQEVLQDLVGIELDGRLDEALGPQQREHLLGLAVEGEAGQTPDRLRGAVGQPVDRAEVEDAEPAVGQQPEVAGVRVGMQQPGEHRAGEQEPGQQQRRAVALLRCALADDGRQRRAVHPLGDEDPLTAGHDVRDTDLGIPVVRLGEGRLALRPRAGSRAPRRPAP